MTPTLVTAPTAELITVDEMRAHLRVDAGDEDPLITMMTAGAVAYLDGYRGVLGRAIMPQTWSEKFEGSGPYRLSMPDASAVTVTADGGAVTGATVTVDALGPLVSLPSGLSPTEAVVEYTCALPAEQLPAVRMAVMLLVGHWFANRESVGERGQEIPLGFDMLISSMRWRSL